MNPGYCLSPVPVIRVPSKAPSPVIWETAGVKRSVVEEENKKNADMSCLEKMATHTKPCELKARSEAVALHTGEGQSDSQDNVFCQQPVLPNTASSAVSQTSSSGSRKRERGFSELGELAQACGFWQVDSVPDIGKTVVSAVPSGSCSKARDHGSALPSTWEAGRADSAHLRDQETSPRCSAYISKRLAQMSLTEGHSSVQECSDKVESQLTHETCPPNSPENTDHLSLHENTLSSSIEDLLSSSKGSSSSSDCLSGEASLSGTIQGDEEISFEQLMISLGMDANNTVGNSRLNSVDSGLDTDVVLPASSQRLSDSSNASSLNTRGCLPSQSRYVTDV